MNVAENIRYFYKSKGLTLAGLAKEINITQQGLSKMLKTDDFKVSYLKKIAKVLDMELIDLLEPVNSEDPFQNVRPTELNQTTKSLISMILYRHLMESRNEQEWFRVFLIIRDAMDNGVSNLAKKELKRAIFLNILLNKQISKAKIKEYIDAQEKIINWKFELIAKGEGLSVQDIISYKMNVGIKKGLSENGYNVDDSLIPDDLKEKLKTSKLGLEIAFSKALEKLISESKPYQYLLSEGYLNNILDIDTFMSKDIQLILKNK